MQRVVGHKPAPHQAPQRLNRLAGIARAHCLMQRIEEARSRSLKHRKQFLLALGERLNQWPLLRKQREFIGQE